MHSFKPLLQSGQIEPTPVVKQLARSAVSHDSNAQSLDLPDFTAPGHQTEVNETDNGPEASADASPQISAYDPPDMGNGVEINDVYVRKYADLKNKVFLPLLTADPDEDPEESARLRAQAMLDQATAQAQQMQQQAQDVLQQAHDSVAHIVQQANEFNAEARTMLNSAQQQAPAIKQSAQEEGFNAGYQDGMEQGMVAGKARLEALLADFSQALKNVAKARDDVAKALSPEIVALVQACLDKIFLAAGSVDAGLVAQVVERAISRLDESGHINVRLNPGNLEHIPKLAPELWAKMRAMTNINWQPDASLHPGDCIIDTPITQIDATVHTRRQRIFAQLEETLQQGDLDLEAILAQAAEKRAQAQRQAITADNHDAPPQSPQPPQSAASAPSAVDADDWADESAAADDDW